MQQASIERSRKDARDFKPVSMTGAQVTADLLPHLSAMGIQVDGFNGGKVREMVENLLSRDGFAMDTNDVGIAPVPLSGLTTPAIPGIVQFLQAWLPGMVRVLTGARKIDEFVGLSTVGSFEDEEVVQSVLENTGVAVPYGDHTNIPLSSWNLNFERRTIVRFEQGMEVGYLESLRSARVRVDTASEKRTSAALGLDIQRNRLGFYGYNGGLNRTYGFLNDPALPAYVNVPNGAGGQPTWKTKTFLEITADIRTGVSALRVNSQDTIDPNRTPITMGVPTNAVDFLSITNVQGTQSVAQWLRETYSNIRVVSAPELNDANGGVGVLYMYAEKVDDGATDDSRTFVQPVPTKFITLGVDKRAKTYVEDYANATAGVMCKRPYAVVRYSGIG